MRYLNLLLLLWPGLILAQTDRVVYVPGTTVKICQLVGEYDRQRQAPTLNRTESRYQLFSTDLGVPFRHNGRTYVLFGDTHGPPGGDAIAYTTDTNPDDGLELTFIHDANGVYRPVTIPGVSQGAFEVPVEGTSINGKMYLYHTTDYNNQTTMGRCILAVSEDDGRTFRYLYDLSSQYFINVSVVEVEASDWPGLPMQSGKGLVMFGSGVYRKSDIRLAFQPADSIESAQSLWYFVGLDNSGKPQWSRSESNAVTLFAQACVGEFSVTYNRFLRKWLMLYNCDSPRGINYRVADQPWGPWSQPRVLFDPWKDKGYCYFIHVNWQYRKCDNVHDPGREYEWGGEYGPYQFEDLATGTDSSTTIYFTLSTWNPYTVVLMKSKLRLYRTPTAVRERPGLPDTPMLLTGHPNPFRTAARIEYAVPVAGEVELAIYDLLGRHVVTLVQARQAAGRHLIRWDGRDAYRRPVSPGLYFCRLTANGKTVLRKLTLFR